MLASEGFWYKVCILLSSLFLLDFLFFFFLSELFVCLRHAKNKSYYVVLADLDSLYRSDSL